MGLILPGGPSWAHWSDNLGDVTSGTGYGTTHAAGASGVDSTPATIISALAHDCEYLGVGYGGYGTSTVDHSTLLDVLVDPAGGTSWSVLIADILVGMDWTGATMQTFAGGSISTPFRPQWLHFPIWLPAGTAIGVQARSAAASPSGNSKVFMFAAGGNRNPGSWWCGQKVETVGTINGATCRGETLTPTQTNFGSWTNFGSVLGAAGGAAQFCVQGEGTGTQTANATVWEFGIGGDRIGPSLWKGIAGGEAGSCMTMPGPIFRQMPAGAQLQARAKCNLVPAGAIDFAAYVVQ